MTAMTGTEESGVRSDIPPVEVDGVSVRFGAIKALSEVSFTVAPGTIHAIIGPNGAGKSTILKLLSRILKPTTGACQVRGRVGALIEVAAGFHPELTGRENVYLQGAIMGMKRPEIQTKFDEIVQFAGDLFFAARDYSQALGFYLKLDVDGLTPSAASRFARCLLETGQPAAALRLLHGRPCPDPQASLVLGGVQFGLPYGIANRTGAPDDGEMQAILALAESSGVTHLDTAAGYGDSEARIGSTLRADSSLRIVTKLPPDIVADNVAGSVQRSRERLKRRRRARKYSSRSFSAAPSMA